MHRNIRQAGAGSAKRARKVRISKLRQRKQQSRALRGRRSWNPDNRYVRRAEGIPEFTESLFDVECVPVVHSVVKIDHVADPAVGIEEHIVRLEIIVDQAICCVAFREEGQVGAQCAQLRKYRCGCAVFLQYAPDPMERVFVTPFSDPRDKSGRELTESAERFSVREKDVFRSHPVDKWEERSIITYERVNIYTYER